MKTSRIYRKHFCIKRLKEEFEKLQPSTTQGVDGISYNTFKTSLADNLALIKRKACAGSYSFTRFKQILLSKGAHKTPRQLSIPTIRDKLALRCLKNVLFEIFPESGNQSLPQSIIDEINKSKENYDGYIKIDIKNFYGSINHDLIMQTIGQRVKKSALLDLIQNAIKTPTSARGSSCEISNAIGIPQGLPISNVLADIYLQKIDKLFSPSTEIFYKRYVDDILILCEAGGIERLKECAVGIIREQGLDVNEDKCSSGSLDQGFTYLGYKISASSLSIRDESVKKYKHEIIAMLTRTRHKTGTDLEKAVWQINTKISGVIYRGKKYGWVFYFSQSTDMELFHKLDAFIKKYATKFDLQPNLFKKVVRAFHEIAKNLKNTTYIPKFDSYSISEKRNLLLKFGLCGENSNDNEVSRAFDQLIFRQTKDLLRDSQNFS